MTVDRDHARSGRSDTGGGAYPVADTRTPRAAREENNPRVLRPMPGGAGLTVVANEAAATAEPAQALLRHTLPEATVVVIGPRGLAAALDERARTAGGRGRVLGVLGGDGTVNAAACAALHAGAALAVFPGGRCNHFAHAAGLHTVADAARAVEKGEGESVDVGLISSPGSDGPYGVFMNTLVLGPWADVVYMRHLTRPWGGVGRVAMPVALALAGRAAKPFDVRLDGRRRRVWLLFVGNGVYHSLRPPARDSLSSGRLDAGLLDAHGLPGGGPLAAALADAVDAPESLPLPERYLATRLELEELAGLRYAYDGEVADAPDSLILTVARAALPVYLPSDGSSGGHPAAQLP